MPPTAGQPEPRHADDSPWRDRQILLGVTGGIACYKSATLVSRLVQAGAAVRVAMTDAAARFVAPLTFQSLSGHPVQTSIWQSDDRPDAQHVALARWCDLFIVAPATANCLAKLAAGICDDAVLLAATALPRATPAVIAPAMNADMWANPVTQRNVATVRDLLGWSIVGPEKGWQACRTDGAGRMSEPDVIMDAAARLLG